jgi:hypothetical protein
MMKTIVTVACCALVAPPAFGQTRSHHKRTTTVDQTVTVTGTVITAAEGAAATSYLPAKTLVIRQDDATKPATYTLNGPGRVVDKRGAPKQIKAHPTPQDYTCKSSI